MHKQNFENENHAYHDLPSSIENTSEGGANKNSMVSLFCKYIPLNRIFIC